jgi:hypothetical protein
MSLFVGRLILFGVIANLAACAGFKALEDKPDAKLMYRHSSSDFTVAWNTVQTGKITMLDGLITNVQNIRIQDIDLMVVVLDTAGSRLSEGTVLLDKLGLRMNDSVSFSVKLVDAIITKGNILEFIISYRINTGSWYGRGAQSRFKVDAVTGVAIVEQR